LLGRHLRRLDQEEHHQDLQGAPLIDPSFVALALIVIAAFTVETTIGFGAMIVALALGTFFFPFTALLPPLVLLDTLLCGYIAIRHRGVIDLRWLLQRIVPLMTVGLVIGVYVAVRAPELFLRRLLGVLVLIIAGRDLLTLASAPMARPALPPSLRVLGLVGAGIMHGIFVTGGPLLVYVLSRSELGKSAFRSTLAVVWVVLDMLLIATYVVSGRITTDTLVVAGPLVPLLIVAVTLGEWAHRQFDERRFRIVVMTMLLAVGVTLMLSSPSPSGSGRRFGDGALHKPRAAQKP
jgi:uncharacterized protein